MAAVDTSDSTVSPQATTLLERIDQVIGWLPKREPPRQDLLRAVSQMGQHLASETLSRGEILNLQVHVLRLEGSPLRTLLNRRVAELAELYGLHPLMKLPHEAHCPTRRRGRADRHVHQASQGNDRHPDLSS